MTVATRLTVSRIVLAPVFYVLYQLAIRGSAVLLAAVWIVFLLIETSDLLDGHFARLLRQESELGKILDPFADAVSRLTYFICFAISGFLPGWILLILVYRDVSVAYIRVILSEGKLMMGARVSGKVKAWIYGFAGAAGIAVFSIEKMKWSADSISVARTTGLIFFIAAAGVALWSLVDYSVFFVKKNRKSC
jgi:CDP-diacylglycerol---glycerol-3-phosphate 3-phosphatidyltransferase